MNERKQSVALTPEAQEELEHEREFLLRSLDDLDDELVAGNIDPDTYRVLHDDYTARAAAVIKSIDDGVPPDRTSPQAPRTMRMLTIGGIVVFALLAAVLLAHTIGQRSAGQEITGDSQSGGRAGSPTTVSESQSLAAAKAAALAAPKSYAAQIAYARVLTSVDPAAAIEQFVRASRLDPKQAEPLAYSGWLTALIARQITNATQHKLLIDVALRNLDQAIAVDPTYAASYVFKGLLYSQIENQQCAGAASFEQYLASAPTSDPMRSQVETALAQAVKAGKCPPVSITPTTKP